MQRLYQTYCFEQSNYRGQALHSSTPTIAIFLIAFFSQISLAQSLIPVPVQNDHLIINLGRSNVFQTPSDIKEIRVADDKVCKAEVIGNDSNSVSVTGLARGSTTLTVWLTQPNTVPQTYILDIVTPIDAYKALNDFILQQSPTSTLTLTPAPSSSKVIVSGAVTSRHEWEKILNLIVGTIPRADLIIRVQIPCPPCIPCSSSCPAPCSVPCFSRFKIQR